MAVHATDVIGEPLPETAMPNFYLVTYFGTILYLDTPTSMVRHAPIGQAAENLTLQIQGDSGVLLTSAYGPVEKVSDLGPGGCRFRAGDSATCELTLERYNVDRVICRWSGRLLTAEDDGSVSLFRNMVGTWEVFLLLDTEDLAELKFILQNSWIQRLPLRIFTAPDICLKEAFGLAIGGHIVKLEFILKLIRGNINQRPSRRLEIIADVEGWKVLFLRLYRPLVYLVAYGSADLFGCASLAIQSLRTFGRYIGDIVLVTDRDHTAASLDIEGMAETIPMQAYDVMDFALARYKIAELSTAWQHQPILYIDTDVICNASLDSLFEELCFSDEIYALPERKLLDEADFYGRTLFLLDPGVGTEADPGISTGIMAFRNVACVEQPFRLIEQSAYAFAQTVQRRDFFPAFDQPFANYVIHKGFVSWKPVTRWAVGSSHVDEPELGRESRIGLIHFLGGVGNASPKINRMRRYIEDISET